MYFYLNEHTFLVLGECKSAVYDLEKNELYGLDKESTEYLKRSENGEPIDEFYDKTDIFKQLEEANLGFCNPTKCFVDKIRFFNNSTSKRKDLTFPFVRNVFIRLNNKCEGNCSDCNSMFCPICLCKDYDKEQEALTFEQWSEVINKISKLGLEQITFTGGDPNLYKDLYKLVDLSLSKNAEVYVVSNGSTPIDEKISKEANIILLAVEDNDYEKLVEDLKKFKKVIVKCRACGDIFKNIQEIVSREDLENFIVTEINTSQVTTCKEDLVIFDLLTYSMKKDFDSCLYGKLYVDYQGDVVPCYYQIDKPVGNLYNDDFNEVIVEVIDKYWYNPVYDTKCSKCEYSYACTACKCYESNKYCKYNTSKGVWE